MLKKATEEGQVLVRLFRYLAKLGNGPFWQRSIVYSIWWLFVVFVILFTPIYLQSSVEEYWDSYSNKTSDISDLNSLMIAKDSVSLCISSVKNKHHYHNRYCDYSMEIFKKHSSKYDDFEKELVEAKAYDQIMIVIDADIRSLDFKAVAKRHNATLQERLRCFSR